MWSISLNRPFGVLSTRRITLFVSAVLMALFTTAIASTTPLQAQTSDPTPETNLMVSWSGEDLFYNGVTLKKSGSTPPGSNANIPSLSGTPCESSQNLYYSTRGTGTTAHSGPDDALLFVACLDDSFNGDKSAAIDADLILYTAGRNGREPTEINVADYTARAQWQVEVAPEGIDGLGNPVDDTGDNKPATTCDSTYTHGIGWIICPVTRWLASGMDMLYNALEGFLVVAPLSTDQDSPLYFMWGMVRNFANLLFIFGFLIIVYSQITSVGISNHGIKRLLPRLIIAAVLVNVSYWVTALAVDFSNIIGTSIKDTFDIVRDELMSKAPSDLGKITWEGIAGVLLSGGAAAAGVAGLAIGVIASAGGSLFFLTVVLMGAIVSALVAVLVLAARQAIITVLIVIAPLAFVAYLLPSTEKYFDRWRSLFMTMLLVFPAFSLIFGGAQLAGLAIMYNASPDSLNYFNLIVLGMAVQIAPVIITPLLIKLSGSLIGRIAGVVNNPNRGMIDRTRKFAQNRHDLHKNKQLWERNKKTGEYAHYNPLSLGARWMALRDTDRQHKIKSYEGGLEAAYAKSDKYKDVHAQDELNEMVKSTGEDRAKSEVKQSIAAESSLRSLYYEQRQSREKTEVEDKTVSTLYEGLKADPAVISKNALERQIGDRAHETDRRARAIASREATAKHIQEKAYNTAMTDNVNVDLRNLAGFSEIDTHGVARVVNIAQETEAKSYENLVQAGQRALQREEATLAELEEIIKLGTSSNPKFAHFKDDVESRSAAIRQFMDTAPMKLRQKLVTELDISWEAPKGTDKGVLRSELAGALKKSGAKPFYISNTRLNEIIEGSLNPLLNGPAGRAFMIQETLNAKGLGTQTMVQADRDDLRAVVNYLQDPDYGISSISAEAQEALKDSLETAFKDSRFKSQMDKRVIELGDLWDTLGLGPRP